MDCPDVKPETMVYNVVVPFLGVLMILINLFVVISSGVVLKKGKMKENWCQSTIARFFLFKFQIASQEPHICFWEISDFVI